MNRVIISPEETKIALEHFRRVISSHSKEFNNMEWGFPNGDRGNFPTYTLKSAYGDMQIGLPEIWNKRVPHLIRFLKEYNLPSPDVEINIPEELDRKTSGIYISTKNGNLLGSRGGFTAFRGKIPRDFTMKHFEKWLIDVMDGNRETQIIPIAAFNSPTFVDDLAEFVRAVIALKQFYKQRNTPTSNNSISWNENPEFEGNKQIGNREPTSYEYLHGPLCNALYTELIKIIGNENRNYTVKKNNHIDAAIIYKNNNQAKIIFEVKTSSSLSSQIYSALGQLFYYKYLYGTKDCIICLVLPEAFMSSSFKLGPFLQSLGIIVFFGNSKGFINSDNEPLEKYISKLIFS